MASQENSTKAPSLVDFVRDDLKRRYQKPGNVYVGLVHRLDQPVSGAILLAKTSKGASRLSDQFRTGSVEKYYWALVEGRPEELAGTWTDRLWKDRSRNLSRVVRQTDQDGRESSLAFRVIERWQNQSWLELQPISGRSHQIRVQLASRGLPILGDRKYGAQSSVKALDGGSRIALHAHRIKFQHPTSREVIEVVASVPGDWPGPVVVTSREV